jgi:uncharacterized membrane protein
VSTPELWIFLFAIGFVAGLRTLTAPAAVAWAAHLGWLNLHTTSLAFLGSAIGVTFFTIGAAFEFVTDQLPSTPSRTVPVQFGARILMGGLSGAALARSVAQPIWLGIVLGMMGAVAGTLLGYQARTRLVGWLKAPAFLIATLEDILAVSAGLFIASRF